MHTASPALMGLVISSSSVVGIICDLLIPRFFGNKTYIFFFWSAIITAIIFPLIFLMGPPLLIFFLIGMAVWGVYYELFNFSDFNFIKSTVSAQNYSNAWGVVSTFKALAYLVGPVLAGWLLVVGLKFSFMGAIIFEIFALLGFLAFTKSLRSNRFHSQPLPETNNPPLNILSGLRIWWVIIKKIWPVYIFLFLLFLIDSTYWTIGPLISESLRSVHSWGSLFLPAYSLPSLFIGLLISRYGRSSGKKRAAFLSAAIAGAFMIFMGIIANAALLIFVVLVSSVYLAVSFPEISAVFEDYVGRLQNHGDEMVGLQGSAVNLAYILGPVLSGSLAALVGNRGTFSVIGIIVLVYSLLALYFVPKKIHLPDIN
jgi:hypothetical protein